MHEFPLIGELDELFRQDPDIDELGIIFSIPPPAPPPVQPDSPGGSTQPSTPAAAAAAASATSSAAAAAVRAEPQFILQQHKLGVSVHSVHPLINEARAAFPPARREYRRLRHACLEGGSQDDAREDTTGEGGRDAVGDESASEEAVAAAGERLLSVTRSLLLVNADHGSAWNARKELVLDGLCSGASIPLEIKLLNLIFTKHAKSPNAWAHRRWCWRNNGDDDAQDGDRRRRRRRRPQDDSRRALDPEDELRVCQRVAEIYPKNYYAWTQRSWVVLRAVAAAGAAAGEGARRKSTSTTAPAAEELLQREVSFVDKWLTSHVSDHSALNHRKNVVSALAALSPAASDETRLGLVQKERSANADLLQDYPGHESLWCYRRFVCQALLVTAPHGDLVGTAQREAAGPPSPSSPSEGVFDWAGWGRAVAEWHDRCVLEDVKAAIVKDSDEEEEEEEEEEEGEEGEGGPQSEDADFEAAVGAPLPGSPAGGGLLAEFLGEEARFALRCATDKGAWQFDQQRRHALAHLAFVSYAAHRIVSGGRGRRHKNSKNGDGDGARGNEEVPSARREETPAAGAASGRATTAGGLGESAGAVVVVGKGSAAGGSCLTYCEVTGAPKLTFPLSLGEGGGAGERVGCVGSGGDGVSVEQGAEDACRGLNAFVVGLAKADAADTVEERGCGGGGVPYAIQADV